VLICVNLWIKIMFRILRGDGDPAVAGQLPEAATGSLSPEKRRFKRTINHQQSAINLAKS
jgi:hypothetical protein